MVDMTFNNIINKGLEMYQEGRFEEAYHYMTEHARHEPRNDAQVYDFRASLACRAGRPEEGLRLLREAVLDKGLWFGQEYLTTDQDIAPLRAMEGFSPLQAICGERERQAMATAASELEVVNRGRRPGGPLFIVLHGNMQNNAIAKEDWRGVGPDLAFIQSSQVTFSDAYVWNDLDRGVKDVLRHWEGLRASGRQVILAGFSAGARLALHLVLEGLVEVDGMVLVGPWLPEIVEWRPSILREGERLPWAYIIIGDQDGECLPQARDIHDALSGAGAASDLRVVEGLGHDYPPDFGQDVLNKAGRFARSRR